MTDAICRHEGAGRQGDGMIQEREASSQEWFLEWRNWEEMQCKDE